MHSLFVFSCIFFTVKAYHSPASSSFVRLAFAAFSLPRSSLLSASSTRGSVAAIASAEKTCQAPCTNGIFPGLFICVFVFCFFEKVKKGGQKCEIEKCSRREKKSTKQTNLVLTMRPLRKTPPRPRHWRGGGGGAPRGSTRRFLRGVGGDGDGCDGDGGGGACGACGGGGGFGRLWRRQRQQQRWRLSMLLLLPRSLLLLPKPPPLPKKKEKKLQNQQQEHLLLPLPQLSPSSSLLPLFFSLSSPTPRPPSSKSGPPSPESAPR